MNAEHSETIAKLMNIIILHPHQMNFSGQHRWDTRHTRGTQAGLARLPLQRRMPVVYRSCRHHLSGVRPSQVGCRPRDRGHSRSAEGARVPDAHHFEQGGHGEARRAVARTGRSHLEHFAADVVGSAATYVYHIVVDASLPGWCTGTSASGPGTCLLARPTYGHRQAHRTQDR